ncbi:MAG: hypothetical protein O3B24_08345 [Verrucomicrobia bacterium]|nr:hypothetical protein [Verrucomicrobiota bacterium]
MSCVFGRLRAVRSRGVRCGVGLVVVCGLWCGLWCGVAGALAEPGGATLSDQTVTEVVRHLYRWHLDESALAGLEAQPKIDVLERAVVMALDAGDNSKFAELVFPQLRRRVLLKRADYAVAETGLRITNADFRVVTVETFDVMPAPVELYVRRELEKDALIRHLYETRATFTFPDGELLQRMRVALRRVLAGEGLPEGTQTLYVAPLSPVANDLWIYWENGARIVRFSSDTDLATPAYWAHEDLGAVVYDLRKSVVVSMAEVAGSNAYVTRDWAARVLFNCVVHGERLSVHPVEALDAPMQVEAAPLQP